MPRSLVRNISDEQNCIIRGSIKNLMEIRRTNVPELAKRTGMKTSTLYARIRDPNTFTIGEIREIYKTLKASDEEKERLAREAM